MRRDGPLEHPFSRIWQRLIDMLHREIKQQFAPPRPERDSVTTPWVQLKQSEELSPVGWRPEPECHQ